MRLGLKGCARIEQFVRNQQGGHGQQPIFANLAELGNEFIDLILEIVGNLRQPLFLPICAVKPVGTPVDPCRNMSHDSPMRSCKKPSRDDESRLILKQVMKRIDHPINSINSIGMLRFQLPDPLIGRRKLLLQGIAFLLQNLEFGFELLHRIR